jgi:hypothetical protein
MYRPNESVDWEIDNDASLNTMGSITNKMGNFTTKLKRGEYALAIYDYNWHDLNATPFKTNNCNLSASNKIKNESPEQLFYIYPNPAKSSISIKFLRKVERQMPLSIYNNNGQLVQNVRVLPHQQIVQIDLNDNKYPSGIYFISTDLNLINENIYYQFEVVK